MAPCGEVLCMYSLLETSPVEALARPTLLTCFAGFPQADVEDRGFPLRSDFTPEAWEPQADAQWEGLLASECCHAPGRRHRVSLAAWLLHP